MTDTVKELRKWVIQIRKANFEGNSFDLCDDDDLLWRAAYEIERLRRQVEALKAKNRHSAPSQSSADPLRAENQRYRTALLGICRPLWSTPPIDSEAASVYARVCKEMIDIAEFAIASTTYHNAPGQADANPSQCPRPESE